MRWMIVALVAAACQRGDDHAAAPASDPAAVVRAFFAAIDAGSCADVDKLVGGALAQKVGGAACAHALDEYRQHRLRLVEVRGATADGRAPEAQLVRLTIERDGKTEDIQVRVERGRITTF